MKCSMGLSHCAALVTVGMNLGRDAVSLGTGREREGRAASAPICLQERLPLCFASMTLGFLIVSLDSEEKAPCSWPITCYHE